MKMNKLMILKFFSMKTFYLGSYLSSKNVVKLTAQHLKKIRMIKLKLKFRNKQ